MKRKILLSLGFVAALVFLAKGSLWIYFRVTHVVSDAAYIKSELANVACEVSGQVLEVQFEDGALVHKGDILLIVNPQDVNQKVLADQAKVSRAEAGVERANEYREFVTGQVEASLEAAQAGVSSAQAQVNKANAYLEKIVKDEKRYQVLIEKEAVTQSMYDAIHAQYLAAQADVDAAMKGLDGARAKVKEAEAGRRNVQVAESSVKLAEAERSEQEHNLSISQQLQDYTSVKAPISGVIARSFVRPGDFAVQGRPLMSLYDPENLFVEVLLEEEKLSNVHIGSEAEVDIDALGGKKLNGRVTRVDAAAASQFSLIPRDQSSGEFIRVVQRVPIRISIDQLKDYPVLCPGLSARIAIRKSP